MNNPIPHAPLTKRQREVLEVMAANPDHWHSERTTARELARLKGPRSERQAVDQWETVEAALEQMKAELPTDFDNVAMEHISAFYLQGPQGETRVVKAGEPDTVEEAAAALKMLYEWMKENTDTPFEACGPVVEAFEAVFSADEASMHLKANG